MHADLENLVEGGRLSASAAEVITRLEPGAFCHHGSWGVGRIKEWDLPGDRLLIDFHEKGGHAMKLEFAAKSLKPIPDEHILARWLADPEAMRQEAEDDPVAVVRMVLESHGSSMSLDQFDDTVQGTLIAPERFKSWWEATKKKLRQDRAFVVPSKRNLPLELRDDDLSPTDALISDFQEARDLKKKAAALSKILSDVGIYDDPDTQLAAVIEEANDTIRKGVKIQPAPAFELLLARDDLQASFPGLKVEGQPDLLDLLASEEGRLHEFVGKLPVAGQRRVYEAFPVAFGDGWPEAMFKLMPSSGLRGSSEIARILLEHDKGGELEAFLQRGVQERNLSSDLLAWVCKERDGAASGVFTPELAPAVLNALEKDHYEEGPRRSNRLIDTVVGDKELLGDLVRGSELSSVRTLSRRLLASPAFDELTRRSLLARIIKVHGEIEELVTGDGDAGRSGEAGAKEAAKEKLIVSWQSLEKKKADLQDITNVRLPANRKEIQIAREYGDLSENFEYKAAKQEQAKLNAERRALEAELKRARGTDFADADTGKVSVGTTVDLQDTGSGGTETWSILGAWDTNLEKGVISYLSETAKTLIGHAAGDEVELPTEEEEVTRKVVVKEIRPATV